MNKTADIVIVAAGKGTRMNSDKNKIFIEIAGKPIICHTLDAIFNMRFFKQVILVVSNEDMEKTRLLCSEKKQQISFVTGGSSRAESVSNGLNHAMLKDPPDCVFVHDAVRPFISKDLIIRLFESTIKFGASLPVINPVETIRKKTDKKTERLNRYEIYLIQTPQVICADYIRKYYIQSSLPDWRNLTDEISVLEYYNQPFEFVKGTRENIKITTPFDLTIAEAILRNPSGQSVQN